MLKSYQYTTLWEEIPNNNFLIKNYFNSSTTPVEELHNINLYDFNCVGLSYNNLGQITTESKFAINSLIDDTFSTNSTKQLINYKQNVINMIENICNITKTNLEYLSYFNLWVLGTNIYSQTEKFINDTSKISLLINNLLLNSNNRLLQDAINIAFSGFQPQSLIDSVDFQEIFDYLDVNDFIDINRLIYLWNKLPNKSNWNQTKSDIPNHADVMLLLITIWAKSFKPLGLIFTDSHSDSLNNLFVKNSWNNKGITNFYFGIGNDLQFHARAFSDNKDYYYFNIQNTNDWTYATNSIMHNGSNNIFSGDGDYYLEFDDPKWIKSVLTNYSNFNKTNGTGKDSSVLVEFQYSVDRFNFSNWITLTSGVDSLIDKMITNLNFKIKLEQGLSDTSTKTNLKPILEEISYLEIIPSKQYYFLKPENVNGQLFEYLSTIESINNQKSIINLGIYRGSDNYNFNDYEKIKLNKNHALPNRQNTLNFTSTESRNNLICELFDTEGFFYNVKENGANAIWDNILDNIDVFIDGQIILPGLYYLDSNNSLINFINPVLGFEVTVNITRKETSYSQIGENTFTNDFINYYSYNGKFPFDSKIYIFINDKFVRSGYTINYEYGYISFNTARNIKDNVTIYVDFNNKFIFGIEVLNYSDSNLEIINLGLHFFNINKKEISNLINITSKPLIKWANLLPALGNINSRLYLDYEFYSSIGNSENNTIISWWIKRTGLSGTQDLEGYVEVIPINGFPDYSNRITERLEDIGQSGIFNQNDLIKVKIIPFDGETYGDEFVTNPIQLVSLYEPYIDPDTQITLITDSFTYDNNIKTFNVNSNHTIELVYNQIDPDNGQDESFVNWYEINSNEIKYTGKVLPQDLAIKNKVYYCIISPFDGDQMGTPVQSPYINLL